MNDDQHARLPNTLISAPWTRKEQENVALADAVAVGTAYLCEHIPYHPLDYLNNMFGDVAGRRNAAVDGGIDNAVVVAAVDHSRNQPDYCFHFLPPYCCGNTRCHHRDHHQDIPERALGHRD